MREENDMYYLRELERKDIMTINKWRNDSSLVRFLCAPYRYINNEVDENWFNSYMSNRKNAIRCAIMSDTSDILIGMVSLIDIDYINRSAKFSIQLGDETNRGKGIGTFATMAMLKHAFENMNLYRIQLEVLASNIRAQHLYEKCGFVKEGCLRNSAYKNGKYEDMFVYSILHEEYIKAKSHSQIL